MIACEKCNSVMELRNVTPCALCGAKESEMKKFLNDELRFRRVSVLGESVVLCVSCTSKIMSYHPESLGIPGGSMEDVVEIGDEVTAKRKQEIIDFVCGKCIETRAWQKTRQKIRDKSHG